MTSYINMMISLKNFESARLENNFMFACMVPDQGKLSMESKAKASLRLQMIQKRITCAASVPQLVVQPNQTAGKFFTEDGYSVVLPEKRQSGKGNVYRSAKSPLKLVSRFPDHPDIGTMHELFVYGSETFQDYKYLGTRIREDGTTGNYTWTTYGETATARSAIGSGLVAHGIPEGSCIGLYFINRPEWLIVDHACSAYSYISVPLYDTLGPDAVKYVVNHSSAQVIFCVPETLQTLLGFLSEIPSVRLLVVVGGRDELMSSITSTAEVKVVSFSTLMAQGSANHYPFRPPKPEDVATICYTSGTTGTPKGAVLSHGNMVANAAGLCMELKFYSSDVYISHLPLAHIYERLNHVRIPYYGGSVGFYQGDIVKLLDDLAILRPTVFFSVPRLYNRLYDGTINAVKSSGSLREWIFNVAYNAKRQALLKGKNASPIWDRLVFNKLKDKLGGRLRYMISGSSPLSPDVMDFLKVCFGCFVMEGYGMTETSCVTTIMNEKDILLGHVGAPIPCCEIKLVDVPEMNYTSDDQPYPRGEICVRGPIVFQGYYKDEVQTREVIDEEGWLHTGDIGMWLHGGRLKIIDRKKNIFKLAQGEYIAPEKIENVYTKSKFVAQCFVYGDSFNSCLVAIVCVDRDMLKAWAIKAGIKHENFEQLCNDPRARNAVLVDMDATGKEAKLRGFEFARSITLITEPFTKENGLLTPTLKVKRPQAKEYFAKAIADMYEEVSAWKSSRRRVL